MLDPKVCTELNKTTEFLADVQSSQINVSHWTYEDKYKKIQPLSMILEFIIRIDSVTFIVTIPLSYLWVRRLDACVWE